MALPANIALADAVLIREVPKLFSTVANSNVARSAGGRLP